MYWDGWDACARGRPLWEQEDAARAGWVDRATIEGKNAGWNSAIPPSRECEDVSHEVRSTYGKFLQRSVASVA
jgi:hypothetical protein